MKNKTGTLEQQRKLIELRENVDRIVQFHQNLKGKGWYLHEGQKQPARELFNDNRNRIWLQCGRSWGKSHLARYVAARFALQNPGSSCYIIAPERKQAHEIHWISGPNNITNILPREYLLDGDGALNKSELRVYLKNGSFIKLDGSDNESSLRGIKPDLCIADEFQSWRPESWVAMEPNFIAKSAKVLIIGTPPDRECFYTEEWKYHTGQVVSKNPRYFYLELPTGTNPRYPAEELEELKRKFISKGEESVWLREYMAKFIPGGVNAVFGTLWSRDKFVRKHEVLIKILEKDANQLKWFTVADPGTTSVFAVLFGCHNPYTSEVYLLDEIYEKDRNKTSATQIFERVLEKQKELCPGVEWKNVADEAAAWFIREVAYHFKKHITPTTKNLHSKMSMISSIKDIMLTQKLHVSSRCKTLCWEIENYVTNDREQLPDKDDHLIDAFSYFVSACNWRLIQTHRPEILILNPKYTLDDELYGHRAGDDWTENFGEDYFH